MDGRSSFIFSIFAAIEGFILKGSPHLSLLCRYCYKNRCLGIKASPHLLLLYIVTDAYWASPRLLDMGTFAGQDTLIKHSPLIYFWIFSD